ncbi:MAG: glycoside hydrolase domain-containing protein, partial [Planctomycetota bacterium]
LDSLWIGEGRDYDEPPDHWMVEVSGIPFGLFGEMLQGGGNPWRGMLYGMTNRLPWSGNPGPIWRLWDEFGIQEADMLGYWSPDCPVRTNQKNVLATVYRCKGKSLVCLASWEKTRVNCRLTIEWDSLELDSSKASLHAPEIPNFQSEKVFLPNDEIPVDPGRGWIFILDETARKRP